MVSPELLRRYPFFAFLNDAQLKAIAMISEEAFYDKGEIIFRENEPAEFFHLLLEGCVDLYFTVDTAYAPDLSREFLVGEINPGEPFGISALIEPYILTSTARAAAPSRVLKVQAAALRALCDQDRQVGYALIRHAAKVAVERLHFTRVQLVAARA